MGTIYKIFPELKLFELQKGRIAHFDVHACVLFKIFMTPVVLIEYNYKANKIPLALFP